MVKGKRIDLDCENCAVKDISKFRVLNEEGAKSLSYHKTCTRYRKGQVLFHEGTRPLGVFCINGGKVKIYRTGYDGKEQIIHIGKGGDLLGYKALISEEVYPVTAETLEECDICFIPKSEFVHLMDENSKLGKLLLREACHELSEMTELVTNLAQKPVRERLAVALLMLKETYGLDGRSESERIEINLTREDLANIIGTATETLIRLLHDFKEEKIIETQGRKIRVIDDKLLEKVAHLY